MRPKKKSCSTFDSKRPKSAPIVDMERCHLNSQSPPPCISLANKYRCTTASLQAMHGYRPGEFFRRGITLGMSGKVGGVGSVVADIRAIDGFSGTPCLCDDVPVITGCSRFCSTKTYLADLEEKRSRMESICGPEKPVSASSSEESQEDNVETKPTTSDAFTMTECCTRSTSTYTDFRTESKAVSANIVMVDVATETEEEEELIEPPSRRSRHSSRVIQRLF